MRNSKLIKKIDNRIYFRVFVALLWSKDILLNYLRGFLLKLPMLSAIADYFIPVILFLMFLLSFKTISERLKGADLVFGMACILVYAAHYLIFKTNRPYFRKEWVDFLIGALPFFFVGVALRSDDESLILKSLYVISCISILAFCGYVLFVNEMDEVTMQNGDMNSAYNILPHACMLFYYTIKEFRLHRLLLFLLSAFFLLMMGTRGAVLCLLVFVVLSSAVTIHFKRPIVLLGMVVVCLLFLFFQGLTDGLMDAAYSASESLGLSNRVFNKLLSGDFTISTARTDLREQVRYYLMRYPLSGLGIYGDRFVAGGKYVHNLFVELYGQFGVIMGSLLSLALAVMFYKGIRSVYKVGDQNAKLIVLLLLGYCFKLFISSSYLREPFFWLLLGYFVALNRERKQMERPARAYARRSKLIK